MDNYNYYEHVNCSLGAILEEKAHRNAGKPYVYFRNTRITYAALNQNANRVANGYSSLGINKGDKVSIMMPNSLEFLYHLFGVAKLGAVDNPINLAYKGEFLRHLIVNSDSRFLLIHEEFVDRLRFIQDDLPDMRAVVVYPSAQSNLKFPTYSFEEVLSASPEFTPKEEVKASDPLQVMYTSGTTGPAKGVVMSHRYAYYYAADYTRLQGLTEKTRTYTCLPLFHINHRFTLISTMLLDGCYAIGERYSARTFWDEIRQHQANRFNAIGGMLYMMYNQPPKPDDADNPAETAFAGPVPMEIAEPFEKRFGVKLYLGAYGLTEAAPITSISAKEADALKAKGKWAQALGCGRENKEFYEVRLVDDDDREVADGDPGEAVCRPTRPDSMMSEYINNPEATVAAWRNLWFHTGDLLRKDEDGYFHFVDRKKDYIRRRGENISSFEVETVVNGHSSIADSAVIAATSELGEEEVRVVIQLKEGEMLTPEELMEWCEPRMPYFMVPRFVEFVREMPRNPVGRVLKFELRQEGLHKSWDRVKAGYQLKR